VCGRFGGRNLKTFFLERPFNSQVVKFGKKEKGIRGKRRKKAGGHLRIQIAVFFIDEIRENRGRLGKQKLRSLVPSLSAGMNILGEGGKAFPVPW